jgi:hypothetical protein
MYTSPWLIIARIRQLKLLCLTSCTVQFLLQGRAGEHADALQRYRQNAEFFVCSCVGKGAVNVPRTPGGVMYHQRWNNLQFVTSASFLLTVYADYATVTGRGAVRCPAGAAQPFEILAFVKSQVIFTTFQPRHVWCLTDEQFADTRGGNFR